MKIRVSYYDANIDKLYEVNGTVDFPEMDHGVPQAYLNKIGEIVGDEEENNEVIGCIDMGGDDEWMDLDIADYEPNHDMDKVARDLLGRVESALVKSET